METRDDYAVMMADIRNKEIAAVRERSAMVREASRLLNVQAQRVRRRAAHLRAVVQQPRSTHSDKPSPP